MKTEKASMSTTALKDLAKIIRSKHSGPFEITFDVMFDTTACYQRVKDSGVLSRRLVSRLYGVDDDDIVACMFFEPALAFKFTLKRSGGQGSIGERDTFGAQQHAPLLSVQIPDRQRPFKDGDANLSGT